MHTLNQISPFVQNVLDENNFTPVSLLRYGPRFVGAVVRHGDTEGFFKMVLPLEERAKMQTGDYRWTEYDDRERLERRLIKEALFLQFFSQELGGAGFEPQIIALSETTPVWSLRTFISEKTMSAWNSDFVFSPRFFETFTPRQCIEFFHRLHEVSDIIPANLSEIISEFRSTLLNPSRFERTVERMRELPAFADKADHLKEAFERVQPRYSDYKKVVTHYEPYPPHIFSSQGQMGLIDWENVGWGHQLQDLAVLYMRCSAKPEWQAEYLKVMEEFGYFEGNGRLFWESEMLIQGLANHKYFAEGGPIGTEEYDKNAIAFFTKTVGDILAHSEYFKA